jgi:hypothetical protein
MHAQSAENTNERQKSSLCNANDVAWFGFRKYRHIIRVHGVKSGITEKLISSRPTNAQREAIIESVRVT